MGGAISLHQDKSNGEKEMVSLPGLLVGDSTPASKALEWIDQGKFLIYQGDYHNARQLLTAIQKRVSSRMLSRSEKQQQKPLQSTPTTPIIPEVWRQYRKHRQNEARIMNSLLLQVDSENQLEHLKRSPRIDQMHCLPSSNQEDPWLISLRDLLGRIGADQMYQKGVFVPHIENNYIHPSFGVFAPSRKDYLDVIQSAIQDFVRKNCDQKTQNQMAFDIGVGTGVITVMLLQTGKFRHVVGTDNSPVAINCARDNLTRMGFLTNGQASLQLTHDIFPINHDHTNNNNNNNNNNKADLIVCNPPWMPPDTSVSWIDSAIFDTTNLLGGFLARAQFHLYDSPSSEAWLVLSNFAELLELRTRDELLNMIRSGNLDIVDIQTCRSSTQRSDRPNKMRRQLDLIDELRSKQEISLFRLRRSTFQ